MYQRAHQHDTLDKGVAFPFVRRLLEYQQAIPGQAAVEVVLLSHNDPETGLRVFHSIEKHGLNISRSAFLTGKSPCPYIEAFNVSLFLSANEADVWDAVSAGFPAGQVIPTSVEDNPHDDELCVAFDFDGVIADDEAEAVYGHSERLRYGPRT